MCVRDRERERERERVQGVEPTRFSLASSLLAEVLQMGAKWNSLDRSGGRGTRDVLASMVCTYLPNEEARGFVSKAHMQPSS